MVDQKAEKLALPTKEQFDIMQNRIAMALAKHEALVKSWTAKSSCRRGPEKTEAELEEEDAKLFHPEPPYLGVGCPIPADFLVSEVERNDKSLRAVFFSKGALKKREEEKQDSSPKRKVQDDSSDEEEGRSSLGKAKKLKRTAPINQKIQVDDKSESMPRESHRPGKAEIPKEAKYVKNGGQETNGSLAQETYLTNLTSKASPDVPRKKKHKKKSRHQEN